MSKPVHEIRRHEPEGWERAFEVLRDGVHVGWFRWLDSAEYYVNEKEGEV